MKRFVLKLPRGRCIMFDFHFRFPLDIHAGFYGKRSVEEFRKLRDRFIEDRLDS